MLSYADCHIMYFLQIYPIYFVNNKKCYLSTIKDAETNEILAYYLSETLELNISLETVKKIHTNKTIILNEDVKIILIKECIIQAQNFMNYTKNIIFNNQCLEEVIAC